MNAHSAPAMMRWLRFGESAFFFMGIDIAFAVIVAVEII
jgi:hypothetical protein